MAHIIVPGQHKSEGKSSPFYGMTRDPVQEREAIKRFVAILMQSFEEDARRDGRERTAARTTEDEKKHRANILARWYRELRGAGLGHIRAMDELPVALRAELDGLPYTPPSRNRLWTPGGDE